MPVNSADDVACSFRVYSATLTAQQIEAIIGRDATVKKSLPDHKKTYTAFRLRDFDPKLTFQDAVLSFLDALSARPGVKELLQSSELSCIYGTWEVTRPNGFEFNVTFLKRLAELNVELWMDCIPLPPGEVPE